jgi:hypothetical protein
MENKIYIDDKIFYIYDITFDSIINVVSSSIIYPPNSLLFSLEISWWAGFTNKMFGQRNLLVTTDKDFGEKVIFSNYLFNRPVLVQSLIRNPEDTYLARIDTDSLQLKSTSSSLCDLPLGIVQDEIIKYLDKLNKNRYGD